MQTLPLPDGRKQDLIAFSLYFQKIIVQKIPPGGGGEGLPYWPLAYCVFCFDRIRTLVAMATYASHRLIMEKSENFQFLLSCCRYLNFVFAEMFIV